MLIDRCERNRIAEEVSRRTLAMRLAKQRARAQGRKAPTMAEMTAMLGDELGVDCDARQRARMKGRGPTR